MSKIEFMVKYKLKADYDGDFQRDKLTDTENPDAEVVGVHGVFRNLGRAIEAKAKCKAWFNKEVVPVEKMNGAGKVVMETRTTLHDNVDVWLERFVDGFLDAEWEESCEGKEKKKELAKV